jgi:hypothetical protein
MIANQIAGLMGVSAPIALTDYESIATMNAAAGGSAYLEFTSISSAYKHLQIRGIARNSTSGSGFQIGYITFNSDTASNYSLHRLQGDGTNATASGTANTAFISTATEPQAGDTANTFGAFIIDILDYSNTNKNKTVRSLDGVDTNGAGVIALRSGAWRNTAAISTIRITASSNNFLQYSSFALYGIK